MPITLAIVGRPNVGKSTLFNRLSSQKLALVHDQPGVTRDWKTSIAHFGERSYRLIDTAGLGESLPSALANRIAKTTLRALSEEADLLLFVYDARRGITSADREAAEHIRKLGLPVVLVANKVEGSAAAAGVVEGNTLGFGSPLPISAEHNEGLNHLFERLLPHLQETNSRSPSTTPSSATPLHLAIVGRPNVGKSTLINRLLGRERVVVGPEAGITRDAVAIDWRHEGTDIRLFDTAGLRKSAKVDDPLETLSAADTQRAIDFAHVVVLVCPAEEGLTQQDLKIAADVLKEGRALVLAVNRIDTVPNMVAFRKEVFDTVALRLEQARGLSVIFLSALTGQGVKSLMPAVLAAHQSWNTKVATPLLNRLLARALERQPLPLVKSRVLKARYMTQTGLRPPTFTLFVNRPKDFPESWLRYLENVVREAFHMQGTPIRLRLKAGVNPYQTRGRRKTR